MDTFKLNILTDLKTVFTGQASYCGIISESGSMGFEAFHEPFIGVLKDNSEVSYTDISGVESSVKLESAMVTFKNNICTIIGNLT